MNGSSLFRKRRRVTDDAPSFIPPAQQSFPSDATQSELVSDHGSRPTTAIRSEEHDPPSPIPQPRRSHRRDSSISSFTDFKSSLRRRSTSLRSKGRDTSSLWDNLASTISTNADRRQASTSRPHLNISTETNQQSNDNLTLDGSSYRIPSSAALDPKPGKTQHFQQAWSAGGLRREENNLRPSTALGAPYSGSSANRSASATYPPSSSDPRAITKRVNDLAAKRISLLNYLRMVYATQTHWFNTYRFTSSQISNFNSMQGTRLTRRTQSLFHLGLSLPFALDPARTSLPDYLRALSALLTEYDNYLTLHPFDGLQQSAYRAKLPGLFKRGVSGAAMAKARRGSSADGMLTSPQSAEEGYGRAGGFGANTPGAASWASFPNMAHEDGLLPGEEYTFLLTPGLPFECDYVETFGTVCDVLCDVYQHLTGAVSDMADGIMNGSADTGSNLSAVAEMFIKVDSKIKKLVLVGLVKEFEDQSRQGIKTEIAGVGKLVLGGLV